MVFVWAWSSQVRGKLGEQQQCGLEVGREVKWMGLHVTGRQYRQQKKGGKKNTAFCLEVLDS